MYMVYFKSYFVDCMIELNILTIYFYRPMTATEVLRLYFTNDYTLLNNNVQNDVY